MEIITTHVNAEFDSFASMVAARRLHPEAVMVFPGSQERNLRLFLEAVPHPYRFRRLRGIRLDKVERLILVDTRRADRIGRLVELTGKPEVTVTIYDHHPPSPHDVAGQQETVAEVGANTTIFVELLHQRGMRITPLEATIFGLGIYEDTGSLSFISTTPRDIKAAAYLLECGMDLKLVNEYVSRELTADQVSLLNDLLRAKEFHDVGGLAVAVAAAERDRFVGDLAVLGHKMKDIENLNVLFILVKMHDRIHLVARSRLPAVDVGAIAAEMGGGGHPTAASAVVRRGTLEEVKARLLSVIRDKVRPVYTAARIMSSRLKTLPLSATMAEAREIMSRFGIDHLPVLDGERLAGIVHRDAVERAVRHGLGKGPAADFMATDFDTLSPDDPDYRIRRLMFDFGRRFLPVVKDGKLLGAVTRSDILGVLRDEEGLRPSWRGDMAERSELRLSRNVAPLMEERLPPGVTALIGRLAAVARRLDMSAYLVGGFVRDLLLGVPNLDLDVVMEGDGIAFAREMASELGGRMRSHKKFETAVVILPDGFKVDVATARMEYYERPGALPQVEHGSIKMDLARRDFTINALAIQLAGGDFGRLTDFFGGQKDLEEGSIRVLHDLSFVDDPTRIFRAVRFETRLNFSISEHTLRLMESALRGNLVEAIVGPRLLGELEDILREKKLQETLSRLQGLNILRAIHPAMGSQPLDPELLERLMRLVADRGDGEKPPNDWIIFLAALVRQFTLEEINVLNERLGMPPGPSRLLLELYVGHRALAASLSRAGLKNSDIHRAAGRYALETVIFAMACYPGSEISSRLERYLESRGAARPLLGGDKLRQLGYEPGPMFKRIHDALRDAQLDGEVTGQEEAVAWLARNFPPG